jgi:hypothetical protein
VNAGPWPAAIIYGASQSVNETATVPATPQLSRRWFGGHRLLEVHTATHHIFICTCLTAPTRGNENDSG